MGGYAKMIRLANIAKQLPLGALGLLIGFNIAAGICQFRKDVSDTPHLVASDGLQAIGIDPESNLGKYGMFALTMGELVGGAAGIVVDVFERPGYYEPPRSFYAVSR